jgi:DNA-binding response OmpR family regulator
MLAPTKIMVVDDEPDVGTFLKHYLSVRRFEVLIANSAEEALLMLEQQPVDIVLLDLVLKGMNGMSAARIIKEKYPKTKVIMVTAHPYDVNRIDGDVPLEGLFTKPMGIEELFAKLSEA